MTLPYACTKLINQSNIPGEMEQKRSLRSGIAHKPQTTNFGVKRGNGYFLDKSTMAEIHYFLDNACHKLRTIN